MVPRRIVNSDLDECQRLCLPNLRSLVFNGPSPPPREALSAKNCSSAPRNPSQQLSSWSLHPCTHCRTTPVWDLSSIDEPPLIQSPGPLSEPRSSPSNFTLYSQASCCIYAIYLLQNCDQTVAPIMLDDCSI